MADLFSTGVLMGVVQNLKRPKPSLLSRFFGTVVNFATEEISFDVLPGKRRVAPFVSPFVAGKVVESQGQTAKTFKPAYLKDKRVFQVNRPFKRAAGEQIGGNTLSPEQRMQLLLASEMENQIDMVTRRLEVMASEAIRLGTVTVAGDQYPTVTVNFQRTAGNTIANLAGLFRWGQASAVPLDNLQDWALVPSQNAGSRPRDVVMGTDAWKQFRKDPEVKARLLAINTFNQSMAQDAAVDEGATYMGTLDGFNIWVYAGWYVDPATDVEGPIWPTKAVAMASAEGVEGVRAFGAIQDEELGYISAEYAAKSWLEKDPAVRYLLMQSAPLTVPQRPDATLYCADVGRVSPASRMFGDADLDTFTADFGVPVTFTGAPAGLKGNLDVADELLAAKDGLAGMIGTTQVVLVKWAAVAALRIDDAITVDGTNYTVRHRARVDDGAFERIYLQDV